MRGSRFFCRVFLFLVTFFPCSNAVFAQCWENSHINCDVWMILFGMGTEQCDASYCTEVNDWCLSEASEHNGDADILTVMPSPTGLDDYFTVGDPVFTQCYVTYNGYCTSVSEDPINGPTFTCEKSSDVSYYADVYWANTQGNACPEENGGE